MDDKCRVGDMDLFKGIPDNSLECFDCEKYCSCFKDCMNESIRLRKLSRLNIDCFECLERHAGCRNNCVLYNKQKKRKQKINEEKSKEYNIVSYLISSATRHKKKYC